MILYRKKVEVIFVKALIAIDSFKGSLSSVEAERAVYEGAMESGRCESAVCCPLADGGEGTSYALSTIEGAQVVKAKSIDSLRREIECEYTILPGDVAVIEVSQAVGLAMLKPSERNPIYTTSYGVGLLILDALDRGCREFIIGLGGSSTNDCGIGMLSALGFEFSNCNPMDGAIALKSFMKISTSNADPRLSKSKFHVACDVDNPLTGPKGATYVFSPQKGAKSEDLELMDKWHFKFATISKKHFEASDKTAGAGAAGGLGYAFLAYLGAELKSGIDLIIEKTGIEEKIKDCDLVITGEGRLDSQTTGGKAPWGVSKLAKKYGKKVIALCGSIGSDQTGLNTYIDGYFSIVSGPCTLDFAMDKFEAYENLKRTTKQLLSIL